VRGEVGAAVAQAAALPREDQLRPDAVRGGREESIAVERMQAGEGAEALRARRLDGGAKPLDDRAGGCQRDPGGGIAVFWIQGVSLRGAAVTNDSRGATDLTVAG
jgi:hypothetical protein